MILYTDLQFPNKKNIKMSTRTFSKSQMVLKPYKSNIDLSNTSKISIRGNLTNVTQIYLTLVKYQLGETLQNHSQYDQTKQHNTNLTGSDERDTEMEIIRTALQVCVQCNFIQSKFKEDYLIHWQYV